MDSTITRIRDRNLGLRELIIMQQITYLEWRTWRKKAMTKKLMIHFMMNSSSSREVASPCYADIANFLACGIIPEEQVKKDVLPQIQKLHLG